MDLTFLVRRPDTEWVAAPKLRPEAKAMLRQVRADRPRIWRDGRWSITTDPQHFDLDAIHAYLTRSTWSAGISRESVCRALSNSHGYALFDGEPGTVQIGFARVITDFATFAYLADVFVLEDYRNKNLGRWLCTTIQADPELQGLRRWLLATSTARELYEKIGWCVVKRPEIFMEIHDPEVYQRAFPTNRSGIT
jgi:GNAT superfamily N-acetyltransferase